MSGIEAIAAIGAAAMPASAAPVQPMGNGFGALLMQGLQQVDTKLAHADALARRFAVDDSIPVHQVTMALEEARLAVELAVQVRTRLLDGYRELMTMQL
jgi:flagellar hook-basal body complex protein FliE